MHLMLGRRPDIAFTVVQLSKYFERPAMGHWKAARRLFPYVTHTVEFRICYNNDCGIDIPMM